MHSSPRTRRCLSTLWWLGFLVSWFSGVAGALAQTAIRAHPENPWIFEFRGQPVVLRTFAEHYGSVIHPNFNYIPYLDTLAASDLNLTRVILAGFHANSGDAEDTLAPPLGSWLQPWPRSSTGGNALDGRGKWNLAAWNTAYFNRLRAFLQACSDRGIIVELTFFNTYYNEEQWSLSPFNPANNVQGIGPAGRYDSMRPVDSNLLYRQTEVVRKIVREVNGFDNVYFEIQNEPFWNERGVKDYQEAAFHNTMLDAIRDEESTLPLRHMVAHNFPQVLDGLSGGFDVINTHYPFAVPSTPIIGGENLLRDFTVHGRPLGLDETTMAGPIEARLESWMFLLGGGAVYNGLDQGSAAYSISDPSGSVSPAPQIRAMLKSLSGYVGALDRTTLRRDLSWIAGGAHPGARVQAMSAPGQQYAAYFYHGAFSLPYQTVYSPINGSNHTTALQVNLPAGSYRAVWTKPSTMAEHHVETFTHPGGVRTLASIVYQEDVALRIDRTGPGDTTPPPPPGGLVATVDEEDFIVLGWNPPAAADLAGFRVYRHTGAGDPDFSGAPVAELPGPSVSYTDESAAPGEQHRYVVTSLDNQGNESRFSTTALAVAPINLDPPVAEAGEAISLTDEDLDLVETVVFNGSASVPGDRPIATWSWRLGGSEIASGEQADAVVPAGIHDVELVVTDEVGLSATDTVRVVVSNPSFANGGFEDSRIGPYAPGVHSLLTAPLAGWVHHLDSNPACQLANHAATEGDTVLILNGGGKPSGSALTQTFPTVPGTTYLVDLHMGVVAYQPYQQRLAVLVRGVGILANPVFSQTGLHTGANRGKVVWSDRSLSFVADAPFTSLTLTDTSPVVDGIDLVIDNVRVRAQADRTLTIHSEPPGQVTITPAPADLNSEAGGVTPLARNYADATVVSVSAPPVSGALGFHHWLVDGLAAGNANPIGLTLTSDITLTAVYETGPPVIIDHPSGLHAETGAAVEFTVTAVSSGDLSYQWRFNGEDIDGADGDSHQIDPVAGAKAGSYEVAVTGGGGTTVSDPAVLSVAVPGFVNGGFESELTGWTVGGNVFPLGPYPGYTATEGSGIVVFNGGNTAPDGVLEQRVATRAGVSYRVSFDAGVVAYKSFSQVLGFEVVGAAPLVSQSIPFVGSGGGQAVWRSFSYTFVADSEETVLRFRDLSPTTVSIDLLLDHIRFGALSPVEFASPSLPLPELGIEIAGDGWTLNLTALAAGTYRVEWTDDLVDWEPLEDHLFATPGTVGIEVGPPPAGGKRFYRAFPAP